MELPYVPVLFLSMIIADQGVADRQNVSDNCDFVTDFKIRRRINGQ